MFILRYLETFSRHPQCNTHRSSHLPLFQMWEDMLSGISVFHKSSHWSLEEASNFCPRFLAGNSQNLLVCILLFVVVHCSCLLHTPWRFHVGSIHTPLMDLLRDFVASEEYPKLFAFHWMFGISVITRLYWMPLQCFRNFLELYKNCFYKQLNK